MTARDKRKFRRYTKAHEFPITFRNKVFRARMLDYSLEGVGALLEGSSLISKGDVIDVAIHDPEIETAGEVVWSCIDREGLRLGIRTGENFRGRIHDFMLSDTLIGLHRSRKTGVMTASYGKVLKKVYFHDGNMIFAASNLKKDRLCDMLLRSGRITSEQYDRTVDETRKTGQKEGAVLVRLGCLKPQELVHVVRGQAEQIILALFTLDDGTFEFRETPLKHAGMTALKLSSSSLIYCGVKSLGGGQKIGSELPSLDTVPLFSEEKEDLLQGMSLDSAGREFVSLTDGRRSLGEIIGSSGVSGPEAVLTAYALYCSGILEFKTGHTADHAGGVRTEAAGGAGEKECAAADLPDVDGIQAMHDAYGRAGYYGVLGIGESAPLSEIKKAYYREAKKYHPDIHFAISDHSVRGKLSDIFSYIYEAYTTLSDPAKRRAYDESRRKQTSGGVDPRSSAEMKFREGKVAFGRDNFYDAEVLFGQATYLDRGVAEYHYYYGLTLLRQGRKKPAVKALERALVLDPGNAGYHCELGAAFLQMGFIARARGHFEKALKISPGHKRAAEGMLETGSQAEGQP